MDAKKLGQFIAEIRREKEMTQAELASKLHVTDKAVSKWERGLGLPDINSIEPLADARHSEQYVEETFGGSLPAFLAAFGTRKKLSDQEIDELQKVIDSMRR